MAVEKGPGMVACRGLGGVAVVGVPRIAPEHRADASLLVGAVDRVIVRRRRTGLLAARRSPGAWCR
jgi:hypothetical protein